jgi:hypothetical protein
MAAAVLDAAAMDAATTDTAATDVASINAPDDGAPVDGSAVEGNPIDLASDGSAVEGSPTDVADAGPDGRCTLGLVASVPYAVGTRPTAPVLSDLNGDGKIDVIVANSADGNIGVLLGNGDGTLRPELTYATGLKPSSVAVADFNGDGVADLAVANDEAFQGVSVLLGNGDGTFKAQVQYPAGSYPSVVGAADVTGDGLADLIVVNAGSDDVSVLPGVGDGTFKSQIVSGSMITLASAMTIADLNGDGELDLAVGGGPDSGVTVLWGRGDGTFDQQVSYFGYETVASLAAADLNGDGKVDLVLANSGSYIVIVAMGAGDGTFSSMSEVGYVLTASPTSVSVGDLDGDGIKDVVIGTDVDEANVASTLVYMMSGNGDGTYQAPVTLRAGSEPQSVAIADFNSDGHLGLVAANFGAGTVSVLTLDRCGGTPPASAPPTKCVSGAPCSGVVNYFCGEPGSFGCVQSCDCSGTELYCELGCP